MLEFSPVPPPAADAPAGDQRPPATAAPAARAPAASGRLLTAALVLTAAIALTALAGRALGEPALTSWGARPTMKLGTVLALLACAGACALLRAPAPAPASARTALVRGLCAAAVLWAAVVLLEWGADGLLDLDRAVVRDVLGGVTAARPSPNTALAVGLLGGALASLDAGGRGPRRLHQVLLGGFAAGVLVAGVGWLYGASSLTGGSRVTGLALPTLTALSALLLAVVCLRPDRPPLALLGARTAAGTLARRLLPAAVLAPPVLGALQLLGELQGWYEARFGLAVFVTLMVVALTLLVLGTARTVERHEVRRRTLHDRLGALLENMPGAVFMRDREDRFVMANSACAAGYRTTVDELLGHTADEFLSPDLAAQARANERPLVEGGEVVTYESSGPHADGTEHHWLVTKYPITDPAGERIGIGGVAVDITARRHAEEAAAEAERRLRQLLEAAPDAMVITDAAGTIRAINAQTERLLGYRRSELVGSGVEVLVPTLHRARHRHHRAGFDASDGPRTMGGGRALRARRKDGSEVPVEISLSPLVTDDGTLVTAAIRDVTERTRDAIEKDALRAVATAVAQDVGAAAIFQLVAAQVATVLEVENGIVVRFESASSATVLGLSVAGRTVTPREPLALDGSNVISVVARTGAAARADAVPGAAGDGRRLGGSREIGGLGLRGGVAAPVTVAGRLWGAVGAATARSEPLPPGSEDRIAHFADLVATAISNAQAWETLARHAATDAVTGLPNYRTFNERLEAEVERARRHERPLSVVLFDLDDFKRVNDTFGHPAGDRVLAEAGRRLAAQARHGELVARVGGEEFAWLLPETDAAGAFSAAERARAAIEEAPFDGVGPITTSAGVCSLEDSGDPDLLLRLADRALYWAKDAGRNTTFRYTDEARAALAQHPEHVERFQSMSSIRALARAIDAKDVSTRSHSERVAALAERLALGLGWTSKRARQLHAAGLLHDVGKIGVPDSILLKPGPLTEEEFGEIRRHPAIGAQIVAEVLEAEPTQWVRSHHERWDGTGYPDGLAGHDIPDGAQLLALADAWDVMTTTRTYKRTRSVQEARAECLRRRGTQFAPAAVDALRALPDAELGPPPQRAPVP